MDPDCAADYKEDAYAGEKAADRDSDSHTIFEGYRSGVSRGVHNSSRAANELAANHADIALLQ